MKLLVPTLFAVLGLSFLAFADPATPSNATPTPSEKVTCAAMANTKHGCMMTGSMSPANCPMTVSHTSSETHTGTTP